MTVFNRIKKLLAFSILLISAPLIADNGKPDLWKIEKDGKTSYLFGSIHLGEKSMYPLSKAVTDAYAATDYLSVEIDLKPGDEIKMLPLVQQYGLDMLNPIEKRLSPQGYEIFQQACKVKALPCAKLSVMRGWLLSTTISIMEMQKLGYTEQFGIDKHFLSLAHKSQKPVISLESAELQFKLLGGFEQSVQEFMLIESLQATNDDYKALFAAWKSGDDDAMLKMFQKGAENPQVKQMYDKIFDQRNFDMVDKIVTHFNEGKSQFVVVGAGHIVGKNGFVDLLQKKGFKATQIQ